MVDTALYVSMSGARESMRSMQVITNNLANSSTVGFQADYETMKPYSANQGDFQTRIYTSAGSSYSSFKQGPIIETNNDLDIALTTPGFIAVQTQEGKKAFTRAGNLKITQDGYLITGKGQMVLSDQGVVKLPPSKKISINNDGLINAQLLDDGPKNLTEIATIKLLDIPVESVQKGEDGLFYPVDENNSVLGNRPVKIRQGALEGSNVDAVVALTQLIDMSRQFEMHTKAMKSIEENALKLNGLISME